MSVLYNLTCLAIALIFEQILVCDNITALGSLVVPDVKSIIYISLLLIVTLLYFLLFDFAIFLPLLIKFAKFISSSSVASSIQILCFICKPSSIAFFIASVYFFSYTTTST